MAKKNFVTYKESQIFAIENNIQSSSEWRKFRKSEKYPQYPENAYKDEWTTWGDFLCNGRIADNLKIYLSYEDAKLFLSTLNLTSSKEYKEWWKKVKPNNLPSNAENIYRKQNVWTSWEDFLSFDRKTVISKQCSEKWMPFEELKELVRLSHLTNKTEFKKWQAGCGLINIPSCPETVYKNLGLWEGWNDFLGTRKRLGIDFKSYEDAKSYLKQYSFKSFSEYREWCKNNTHINIPANPEQYYKKCGTWVSMSDYLGNNNIKNKVYSSYEDAKKIVSKIGLKSVIEYIQWWKNERPQNIPRKPEKVYSSVWTCWGDFLGCETIVGNAKKYVSYKEAEIRVQEMGFKTATEFKDWVRRERMVDIPLTPDAFYKNEWISWPIFLGNSNVHKWNKNNLLPFEELKNIVRFNHITSVGEYMEWYKNNKIKGVPYQPQKQYQDEWISWGDFLGVDYITQSERDYYSYDECSKIVRELNITKKDDFFEFLKTNKDKKIPGNPVSKYQNEWVSWGDFLGTNRIANQNIREYKFNLLNEFVDEFRLRDFLMTNDENLIYIILRNIEKIDPKFNPIVKDIDRVLRSDSTNPIEDLENKYRASDETVTSDTVAVEINTTTIDDIDLDDDDAVEAFINNTNTTVEKTEPTIDELTRARENEINLINTIEHMLTPEDRQFIKDKFLNDKRRNWMLERDKK